jgi:tRNA dimethylallyltransferase
MTYDELVDAIQQGSRHYAKRQFTWFKRYDNIKWLNLDELSTADAINEILKYL